MISPTFKLLPCGLMLLILALAAQAQAPAENLDTVLRDWQKAMTEAKTFVAEVQRTTEDKAFGVKDEYKGYILLMKTNNALGLPLARLEVAKVTNANVFEKYIFTGAALHEYAPVNQVVRIHQVPNLKGAGVPQDSFLAFLFGMGLDHAKSRYKLELDLKRSTADWICINVDPKNDQDKRDFTTASLTLYRSSRLLGQVWYRQQNGNETTWNFTKVRTDVPITAEHFKPVVPQGWRVENVKPEPVNAPRDR